MQCSNKYKKIYLLFLKLHYRTFTTETKTPIQAGMSFPNKSIKEHLLHIVFSLSDPLEFLTNLRSQTLKKNNITIKNTTYLLLIPLITTFGVNYC